MMIEKKFAASRADINYLDFLRSWLSPSMQYLSYIKYTGVIRVYLIDLLLFFTDSYAYLFTQITLKLR